MSPNCISLFKFHPGLYYNTVMSSISKLFYLRQVYQVYHPYRLYLLNIMKLKCKKDGFLEEICSSCYAPTIDDGVSMLIIDLSNLFIFFVAIFFFAFAFAFCFVINKDKLTMSSNTPVTLNFYSFPFIDRLQRELQNHLNCQLENNVYCLLCIYLHLRDGGIITFTGAIYL